MNVAAATLLLDTTEVLITPSLVLDEADLLLGGLVFASAEVSATGR